MPGKLKTEERVPTDYPTYSKNIADLLQKVKESTQSLKVASIQ